MKRQLIVLMGLDGSGKTTQANLLASDLGARGIKAEVVWMRGESYLTRPLLKVAKTILRAPKAAKRGQTDEPEAYERYVSGKRSVFKNRAARGLWRSLVIADFYITLRIAFSKIPSSTRVVLLDRYLYDSLIDIVSGYGGGEEVLKQLLASKAARIFPRPDMVVLLDLEPAEAMRRKDDIPSLGYLEERYDLYHVVAREVGAVTVDASRPLENVRAAIAEAVKQVLPDSGSDQKGDSR